MSDAERAAGFRLLFNGVDLTGWRAFKNAGVNGKWKVEDSAIVFDACCDDLITSDEFGNFELVFDWRIQPAGNSGLMYLVKEDSDTTYNSGPEYQLVDNAGNSEGAVFKHNAGSMYDLVAPSSSPVKPVGEYNTSRVIFTGNKIEHWLNGVKLFEQTYGDAAWADLVAHSRYAGISTFGHNTTGHIALQQHGDKAWFRNIKIRPL